MALISIFTHDDEESGKTVINQIDYVTKESAFTLWNYRSGLEKPDLFSEVFNELVFFMEYMGYVPLKLRDNEHQMIEESFEVRALTIAVRILRAAGVCRYDDVTDCNKSNVDDKVCDKCIKSWLLDKAREELHNI